MHIAVSRKRNRFIVQDGSAINNHGRSIHRERARNNRRRLRVVMRRTSRPF